MDNRDGAASLFRCRTSTRVACLSVYRGYECTRGDCPLLHDFDKDNIDEERKKKAGAQPKATAPAATNPNNIRLEVGNRVNANVTNTNTTNNYVEATRRNTIEAGQVPGLGCLFQLEETEKKATGEQLLKDGLPKLKEGSTRLGDICPIFVKNMANRDEVQIVPADVYTFQVKCPRQLWSLLYYPSLRPIMNDDMNKNEGKNGKQVEGAHAFTTVVAMHEAASLLADLSSRCSRHLWNKQLEAFEAKDFDLLAETTKDLQERRPAK